MRTTSGRTGIAAPGWNTAEWVREVAIARGVPFRIGDIVGGSGIEVEVLNPSVWIGGPWRLVASLIPAE